MKKYLLILPILVLILASCQTPKQMLYFPNLANEGDIVQVIPDSIKNYESRIVPDDMLTISVSALDPNAVVIFNLPTTNFIMPGENTISTTPSLHTYLVDKEGYIDFPVMNRTQLYGDLFGLRVSGDSMIEAGIMNGDIVIVQKEHVAQNGDIVVVQEQNGYFKGPIVKRIIAKGGQTIRFDFESWKVWVDGELLDEDYVNYQPWFPMESDGCPEELVVPEGYLFVMGDNRNGSTDSRNMSIVGFVSEDEVMGRVIFRLTGRFGKVS